MHRQVGKRGFTLIELIVVIGIIAVLATMGISSYTSVRQDARNAKRKGDLKELQKTLEAYKARHGHYPPTDTTGAHVSGHKWHTNCNYIHTLVVPNRPNKDEGTNLGWIPGLAPEFIPNLPTDPRSGRPNPERSGGSTTQYGACAIAANNCYKYMSNGSDYKLVAHCTPEGELSEEDAFFDPQRNAVSGGITYMWAWQVSSSANTNNW